jgi:hypothetical protein
MHSLPVQWDGKMQKQGSAAAAAAQLLRRKSKSATETKENVASPMGDDSPPGQGDGTTAPTEQKAPGGQKTAEHRESTSPVALPKRPLGHSVGDGDPEGQGKSQGVGRLAVSP